MSAPVGTPVHAVFAGRVAFADRYDPFGQIVILDHGDHYYTLMGDLSSIDVRVGDDLSAGAKVGTVGTASVGTDGEGRALFRGSSRSIDRGSRAVARPLDFRYLRAMNRALLAFDMSRLVPAFRRPHSLEHRAQHRSPRLRLLPQPRNRTRSTRPTGISPTQQPGYPQAQPPAARSGLRRAAPLCARRTMAFRSGADRAALRRRTADPQRLSPRIEAAQRPRRGGPDRVWRALFSLALGGRFQQVPRRIGGSTCPVAGPFIDLAGRKEECSPNGGIEQRRSPTTTAMTTRRRASFSCSTA